jgi:serine phosphatase RsbU (regulator of sigma subunit)
MKLNPFQTAAAPAKDARPPVPTKFPEMKTVKIAAQYRAARVGGDFYDFVVPTPDKLLFIFLDIAGKRDTALKVAANVQDFFRKRCTEIYSSPDVEDSDAVTKLTLEVNRKVMEAAGGVCMAPAFIGCYDETINTLSYINAGHIPGLMQDEEGTLLLQANGLPLGLFSHSTHDSQFCTLVPGSMLMLVSKGLVETKAGGQEFGIHRVQQVLDDNLYPTAEEACKGVLAAIENFEKTPTRFGPSFSFAGFGGHEPNDITTIAIKRT